MKIPLFSIEPLLDSYYIEQIGDRKLSGKESRTIKKSEKTLKKSIDDLIKWIVIEYNGKQYPVLLKKSLDNHVFMTGPLRLKKAKTEKDLEYWKKKLLDLLRTEKSLSAILYPGEVPELAEELLLKARGYPVGTTRTWKGKEYKKVSDDKWIEVSKENIRKEISESASFDEVMAHFKKYHTEIPDKEKSELLEEMKEAGVFDKVQNTSDLSNIEDYNNWFDINYKGYVDNLPKDIQESVWSYIGNGYKEIKECLTIGNCTDKAIKDIANIDKYFKDAPKMKEGIGIYRGEPNISIKGLNVGDEYSSNKFISFSTNLKKAMKFTDNSKIIIKSLSSENTVPTLNVADREIIFNRNTILIVSKKYKKDGVVIMEVEEK